MNLLLKPSLMKNSKVAAYYHHLETHLIDSSTFWRALICWAAAQGTHNEPSTSWRLFRVTRVNSRSVSAVVTMSNGDWSDWLNRFDKPRRYSFLVETLTHGTCIPIDNWNSSTQALNAVTAWLSANLLLSTRDNVAFFSARKCSETSISNLVNTTITGIDTAKNQSEVEDLKHRGSHTLLPAPTVSRRPFAAISLPYGVSRCKA